MDRIAACRREIARWKKVKDINSKTKIDRLQKALESEIAKTTPSQRTMRRLKLELASAHKEEERFWMQKSREQWLREGDKNTTFFHNAVKGRRIKNKVLRLIDNEGNEHFSEGAKGHVVVEFYRDLFMSTNPHDLETLFEGFLPRISPAMNTMLTSMVTEEEIKNAAFSVKGSSAPGEDGLTGYFYQKFWHIVGPSITSEIQSFFSSSRLPDGWNHTYLCLLPKVTNPTRMTEMRSISLCSVQYKIISKILCERLKRVLPEIISETQGAFVAGRLISDNILIAHEMIHGLRTNDMVSDRFMAVKTDMSKAYDRVEWPFIEILLTTRKLSIDSSYR